MNPSYFLFSLLTVIAICPAQASAPSDSISMVEVFTTREQYIRSESHAEVIHQDQGINLQAYLLDGIQQFESMLSKELPTDFKQSNQIALQPLQHLDAKPRGTVNVAVTPSW